MTDRPIWTVAEARAADQMATSQGVLWSSLVELAGHAVAAWVMRRPHTSRVLVLVGPGANGGDGLVAARWMARSLDVTLVLAEGSPRFPGADDFMRAAETFGVKRVSLDEVRLTDFDCLVDALYGTGFHGDLAQSRGFPVLREASRLGLPVVAVDMLSGVNGDTGHYAGPLQKVEATVTFGAAKWGHVGYPGASLTGRLVVADIGLDSAAGEAFWYGPDHAQEHMPGLQLLGHKYQRGHVVVIGGSPSMPGAPILSAEASLRAGAGLVEVMMPEGARGHAATSPALIVHGLEASGSQGLALSSSHQERLSRAAAIVFGPGLGRLLPPEFLRDVLSLKRPTVVDADGLLMLKSLNGEEDWAERVVITPHAGELAGLLDQDASEINRDRRGYLLEAQRRWGCGVLLKGHYTLSRAGQRTWVNPTGGPALATAGSGDVLSGVIARLLASGLHIGEAMALGAYWHGWAGDIAEARHGPVTAIWHIMDGLDEGWRKMADGVRPGGLPEEMA